MGGGELEEGALKKSRGRAKVYRFNQSFFGGQAASSRFFLVDAS
jgi:hypothetical protein